MIGRKILHVGQLIILTSVPFTITVELFAPSDFIHPLVGAKISLADIAILLTFLFWIIYIVKKKKIGTVKLPPRHILLFVGIAFFSFLNAFSLKEWMKEFGQFFLYFIVYYTLLVNSEPNEKMRKKEIFCITLLFIVVTVVAIFQSLSKSSDPYLVRGLFENRHILGAFYVCSLPILFGYFLYLDKIWIKNLFLILFVSVVYVTFAPASLVAIIVGCLVIAYVNQNKMVIVLTFIVLCGSVVFSFCASEKSKKEIIRFASLYERNINESYSRIQTILYDLPKSKLYDQYIGRNRLVIKSDLFMSSQMPTLRQTDRYKEREYTQHIKQSVLEQQAALNMMGAFPLLGVGLGNFQKNVSQYYGELPKTNTTEPNIHNGYLVIGATTGLFGLVVLIYIFAKALAPYRQKRYNSNVIFDSSWSCGVLGSISALMVYNFFFDILVSGITIYFVWILFSSQGNDQERIPIVKSPSLPGKM